MTISESSTSDDDGSIIYVGGVSDVTGNCCAGSCRVTTAGDGDDRDRI